MGWEQEAASAVDGALRAAEIDDLRGTVTIFSTEDRRYDQEFNSIDDLTSHLIELRYSQK
jgi:hypothetical protein